ncbi:hypothetical protein ZWY2020_043802 [Hordeum vulgare]|nr:hypothetical protein ZWY2020_043802 [Hordeum vulgare]
MLKPALARGRIRCVAATTLDEYNKYVEKDAALERRFQKVHVEEPSTQSTIAILRGLKERYEQHHGLEIKDAALVAATTLAARYITGEELTSLYHRVAFPKNMMQNDKQAQQFSIALTASAVKEAIVGPDQVAQVVSRWTGIPVTTLNQGEKDKLIHLAARLHERVVGQDEAVNKVARAVLRSRTDLDQPGQPIGSFLFLGSTGVGKTELAKALAEQLFDSEKMLVRIDMSEYVGAGSVWRLIGAPPGYYEHQDGGQLTEKVRRRPYSVILFDEVEKADPLVLNVFLQLLDDGLLTDGKGRIVDFKNTIIIMTSNVGSEHLMAGMSGETTMETARSLLMKQVQKHYRPELLNRLGAIIVFERFREKLKDIVAIQMKSVVARMYGARPIRRWVQENVMTTISEMLVNDEAGAGSTISIDATDDKKGLKYEVVKGVADPAVRLPNESGDDSDTDGNMPAKPPCVTFGAEGNFYLPIKALLARIA